MIPDEKYDLVRQLIQRQFDSDSEVYLTLSIDGVVTNLTVITENQLIGIKMTTQKMLTIA